MSYTLDEVVWLIDHPDVVQAAENLELSPASRLADLTTLRGKVAAATYGDVDVAALSRATVELVTARIAAERGTKIPEHLPGEVRASWMVCTDSAQQATPSEVAAVRSRHLAEIAPGTCVADVTCSVGSELAHLESRHAFRLVVGADLDPVRLTMARHNLPDVPLIRADAVAPACQADVIVADPARRNERGRIRDPRDLIPPLPDLVSAWSGRGAELAVKCAPGIDYSQWEGQVDIVGVSGGGAGVHGVPGVKEACLYSPGLSRYDRRAVVIGPHSTGEVTSEDPESDVVSAVGRYILDPDGAVVRAGLVQGYAARLGWWRIDPHIAYLSGDRIDGVEFLPGQRVFEVLDVVTVKKLRVALKALGCGPLEIMVRGADIVPDDLRRTLRRAGALAGDVSLTVVLARVGDSPVAVIGRPVPVGHLG